MRQRGSGVFGTKERLDGFVALLDARVITCGGAMLQKLTEKQAECLEAAARCRARAEATSDPIAKQDFLEMAHHWEVLARSYSFNEQLKDFIASRRR
jgi:hypothetical protein